MSDKDLIKRLRHAALIQWQHSRQYTPIETFMESEAADLIEQLKAIIERRDQHCQDCPTFVEQDAHITRMKAENEQFRAALEEIEENATSEFEDGWCGDLAREALAALQETTE